MVCASELKHFFGVKKNSLYMDRIFLVISVDLLSYSVYFSSVNKYKCQSRGAVAFRHTWLLMYWWRSLLFLCDSPGFDAWCSLSELAIHPRMQTIKEDDCQARKTPSLLLSLVNKWDVDFLFFFLVKEVISLNSFFTAIKIQNPKLKNQAKQIILESSCIKGI